MRCIGDCRTIESISIMTSQYTFNKNFIIILTNPEFTEFARLSYENFIEVNYIQPPLESAMET